MQACQFIPGTDANLVSEAEKAVRYVMFDPDAAKFRNERVIGPSGNRYVCGEVNGKNRMGAYVGYSIFQYDVQSGQVTISSPDGENTTGALENVPVYCLPGADPPPALSFLEPGSIQKEQSEEANSIDAVANAATVTQNSLNSSGANAATSASDDTAYVKSIVAGSNYVIAHPKASDAEVLSVVIAAARAAGERPSEADKYVVQDARAWARTRKANGYPGQTTTAELMANDARADAAERERLAAMPAEERKPFEDIDADLKPSRGVHYFPKIGACFDTTVKSVGSRLEGMPDSGDEVEYTDGHAQTSYVTNTVVRSFRVGDPVRLCVIGLPGHCPPADDRGIDFAAVNGRTGDRWEAPDAEHECGGA